jgi:hypothetical protein
MPVAKINVEMKRYFVFMEDVIALLEKMEYYQGEMIFRQSTIKDELMYIIRMKSTLIENFTEYDVIDKSEEIYYFLIREGYIYEDLNDAQVKLGKKYFKEFANKKKKKTFIANLLVAFGLGFFLNT